MPAVELTTPKPGSVPEPTKRRATWIVPVAAVIVVVILGVGAYYVLLDHKAGGGGGPGSVTILAPQGSYYSIPVGQFNGITFIVSQSSEVNGTFYTSYGVLLYQMTPTQYLTFTKTLHLDGYEWSYNVTPDSSYALNLTVTSGSWVLAFVNPYSLAATGVGFYTNLILAPT